MKRAYEKKPNLDDRFLSIRLLSKVPEKCRVCLYKFSELKENASEMRHNFSEQTKKQIAKHQVTDVKGAWGEVGVKRTRQKKYPNFGADIAQCICKRYAVGCIFFEKTE